MNEEILRVLDMVKKDKISPEDGEKLIAAITGVESKSIKKSKFSMLRVRVLDRNPNKTEQTKVNINVPLSIAKKAVGLVSLIPNEAKKDLVEKGIDLDSFNIAELIEMFEDGEITEELVNIVSGDEESGTTVKVYVD